MHVSAFLAYMALMGTCGVLDHSGVRLRCRLPWGGGACVLYDSGDHDVHHSAGFGGNKRVNLGFPFPVLDRLHGTYAAPQRTRRA
jgi:sterol desaturase/sphingolipid hydroxylase (fatty acid hydroxylase superfamily)